MFYKNKPGSWVYTRYPTVIDITATILCEVPGVYPVFSFSLILVCNETIHRIKLRIFFFFKYDKGDFFYLQISENFETFFLEKKISISAHGIFLYVSLLVYPSLSSKVLFFFHESILFQLHIIRVHCIIHNVH